MGGPVVFLPHFLARLKVQTSLLDIKTWNTFSPGKEEILFLYGLCIFLYMHIHTYGSPRRCVYVLLFKWERQNSRYRRCQAQCVQYVLTFIHIYIHTCNFARHCLYVSLRKWKRQYSRSRRCQTQCVQYTHYIHAILPICIT